MRAREGAGLANSIKQARQRYAEELRFTAGVGSREVVTAFASVPRERFVGPGPWRVRSPMNMREYWTTEDADPRHERVRSGLQRAWDQGKRSGKFETGAMRRFV